MEKLITNYLGLKLKSPLIVSSCRLTSSVENMKEAEASGAGAIVLKSLFEEQINHYLSSFPHAPGFPEADEYLSYYIRSHSVDEYINLISRAKKTLGIPVIPSINCFSSKGWTDFAAKISDSGADALEINLFFMPLDMKEPASETEKIYFELIEKLTSVIKIPIVLKIGFRFTNILYMIDQFYMRGIKGIVMFNRFFEPDIDVDKLEIIPAEILSTEAEKRNVLRWIAIASALNIKIDISASTGVNSGTDAVKYLLAGADTVQVCSVLYRKGISFLGTMNSQIIEWMDSKGFKSTDDFRGKLNWSNIEKPEQFERTQFMKHFSSME
jgi:dihydroorotate dehydrogenase (fumarate)